MGRAGWFRCLLALAALLSLRSAQETTLDAAARAIEQGKPAEAKGQLEPILKQNPDELRALILMGAALDAEQHYRDADPYYERALKIAPDIPQVLNNAGNHFLTSGNRARARQLYLRVLQIEPGHANANLQLAELSVEDRQGRRALQYLGRLGRSGTGEAGVDLLRARALSLAGRCAEASDIAAGLHDPSEANSSLAFSAGMVFAECKLYDRAEVAFSAALHADPRNFDILYNLGWAALRAGHSERAVSIFNTALAQRPEDPDCFYGLSQAYLHQNRPVHAAALLVKARRLAPGRTEIVLLLAQVSSQLEFYDDAASAYSRYLKLRPGDEGARRELARALARSKRANAAGRIGLVEFLSLPPAAQRTRYLNWLRENVAASPGDSRWKLTLAGELLSDGNSTEAVSVLAGLRSAGSQPDVLAGAGRLLLEFEQYEPARDFLEAALAGSPSLSSARLDLAIALFQFHRTEAALGTLDGTLPQDRKGDYYLLRAQILDALGKTEQAADSLNRGMQSAPARPGLYFQAAGFLLKHRSYLQALSLLEQACRILPDARELLLAQAVALIHLKRMAEAQDLLVGMQARWPEWERPYLLNGILLELQRKSEEARKLLQTAIDLGADTAEAHYYEALAITHAAPEDVASARKAINRALALAPQDPYVCLLAGKIALADQDHTTAIQRLRDATRLKPDFIPAHYALTAAYRGAGDQQKADAEAEEVARLSREKPASEQRPFSEDDFLFAVRLAPGSAEAR